MPVEAYKLQVAEEGLKYQDRIRRWVWCPECGAELDAGSLQMHHQAQNRMGQGDQLPPPPPH